MNNSNVNKSNVKNSNVNKRLACKICGKNIVGSYRHLKRHEILHTGEKPYQCQKVKNCERKFSDLDNLKRHEITHSTEKRYSCPNCSKQFTRLSSLKTLQKKH